MLGALGSLGSQEPWSHRHPLRSKRQRKASTASEAFQLHPRRSSPQTQATPAPKAQSPGSTQSAATALPPHVTATQRQSPQVLTHGDAPRRAKLGARIRGVNTRHADWESSRCQRRGDATTRSRELRPTRESRVASESPPPKPKRQCVRAVVPARTRLQSRRRRSRGGEAQKTLRVFEGSEAPTRQGR